MRINNETIEIIYDSIYNDLQELVNDNKYDLFVKIRIVPELLSIMQKNIAPVAMDDLVSFQYSREKDDRVSYSAIGTVIPSSDLFSFHLNEHINQQWLENTMPEIRKNLINWEYEY